MEGFTEGSTVEVRSKEDGFQNAWFSAVILEPPTHTLTPSLSPVKKKTKRTKNDNSKVVVRYPHMLADDGKELLVEKIDSFFVRPTPPPPDTEPDKPFAQNDVVDAFHHDIWWTGVIINVENDNHTLFASPSHLIFSAATALSSDPTGIGSIRNGYGLENRKLSIRNSDQEQE